MECGQFGLFNALTILLFPKYGGGVSFPCSSVGMPPGTLCVPYRWSVPTPERGNDAILAFCFLHVNYRVRRVNTVGRG